METHNSVPESFDENKSLQVIREMIEVSRKRIQKSGVLFILWGWLMFYNYISGYIVREIVLTYPVRKTIEYIGYALGMAVLAFTVYSIFKQRRKVQTYIGISLRWVWFALLVSLVIINLIQYNVLHKINFELQHPVFMVVIAFAIVVTGGILRYRLIIAGGIVFGILAYGCSYLQLQQQILVEAIAWVIAFVIPGHILFAKRKQ